MRRVTDAAAATPSAEAIRGYLPSLQAAVGADLLEGKRAARAAGRERLEDDLDVDLHRDDTSDDDIAFALAAAAGLMAAWGAAALSAIAAGRSVSRALSKIDRNVARTVVTEVARSFNDERDRLYLVVFGDAGAAPEREGGSTIDAGGHGNGGSVGAGVVVGWPRGTAGTGGVGGGTAGAAGTGAPGAGVVVLGGGRTILIPAGNTTEVGGRRGARGRPLGDDVPLPGAFKVWSALLDSKTCPSCFAADGEVVEIHKPFSAGTCPLHPFCRCVTEHLIVTKPERLEDIAIDYELLKEEIRDLIREGRIESERHALKFVSASLGRQRSPTTLTKKFRERRHER